MYKPSTYLVVTYFPTYLPIYDTYFLQNWLPRFNQILTQLRFTTSNSGHLVDGAGSLWPDFVDFCAVFFYWRIFGKSRPEKCDFDQYKGFFMGKIVQIRQISKRKKFTWPDLYNKFE